MKQKEQPIGVWQYFMLVLSIVALGLLAVQSFLPLDPNTRSALRIVDTFVCVVFFADFVWQLIRSRPRIAYLKWGWLDLISSIPMLPGSLALLASSASCAVPAQVGTCSD